MTDIEVNSELSWEFTMVKNAILDSVGLLSTYEKMIYICLYRFANLGNGEAFPKRQTIADLAGCSVRQVDKSIKRLTELGLLRKEVRPVKGKKNETNLYTFLEIPQLIKESSYRENPVRPIQGERHAPNRANDVRPLGESRAPELYDINENHKELEKLHSGKKIESKNWYNHFYESIGRVPTAFQIQEIDALISQNGIQEEAIVLLLKRVAGGDRPWSLFKKISGDWLDLGIKTADEARRDFERHDKRRKERTSPQKAKDRHHQVLYSSEQVGF